MNRYLLAAVLVLAIPMIAFRVESEQGDAPAMVPIQIPPERRQLIGLKIATVERREVQQHISATGTVEPDERLKSYVQMRFSGWIDQVFANQTWQRVRKEQPLFTIYSPDIVSTEHEYLVALDAVGRVRDSSVPNVAVDAKSLLDAAGERLELWGVPAAEINRLRRERSVRRTVTIISPASGYVSERNAIPGMYVHPDTRLYVITGLSRVWVYAAVFQHEIGSIRTGDRATVAIDSYPGQSFHGRVDYIWPEIDTSTRTARVRLAFDNRDGRLKLGMYGRVTLDVPLGAQVVIPQSGVLRTGIHNLAFLDRGDGYLTPIAVELGARVGDDLVVLKGLRPGQRIVSSANFLVDSESQLQTASGAFAPPPPAASAVAAPPGAGAAVRPVVALEVTTDPDPPVRGRNRVHAALHDANRNPIAGAHITVTFSMAAMPAMEMTAKRAVADLSDRGGGLYDAEVNLESTGTWKVTAVATTDGQPLATRQFNLSVAGRM